MRYGLVLFLAILALTTITVGSFRHLSVPNVADSAVMPVADTVEPPAVRTTLYPTDADYARFAAADRAWRERNARQYTLAELKARGDGRRSPREQMQDRVFQLTRRGQRAQAIAELEHWVAGQPRDAEALLSLARLLNETGRTDSSIARYRQVMALRNGGQ